jgi:phosphoribosylglycinamide formyltransferase-1
MKRIIICTGSELRHTFFRQHIAFSKNIEVLRTYVEIPSTTYLDSINDEFLREHLISRNVSEKDFFDLFINNVNDNSKCKKIEKGEINSDIVIEEIVNLKPDLLITFGCSIIDTALIKLFPNKIINVHLGLSPYYRGSGTNFFPFVNNEPEFIGVTFMYMDQGIDTGEIIHQIRPHINIFDNMHQIGNRLIVAMTFKMEAIIENFDFLVPVKQIVIDIENSKYYKKSDFNVSSLNIAYENLKNGLLNKYLLHAELRNFNVPIVQNEILK